MSSDPTTLLSRHLPRFASAPPPATCRTHTYSLALRRKSTKTPPLFSSLASEILGRFFSRLSEPNPREREIEEAQSSCSPTNHSVRTPACIHTACMICKSESRLRCSMGEFTQPLLSLKHLLCIETDCCQMSTSLICGARSKHLNFRRILQNNLTTTCMMHSDL